MRYLCGDLCVALWICPDQRKSTAQVHYGIGIFGSGKKDAADFSPCRKCAVAEFFARCKTLKGQRQADSRFAQPPQEGILDGLLQISRRSGQASVDYNRTN